MSSITSYSIPLTGSTAARYILVCAMTHPKQPRNRDGFEIAVICALKVEADAVEAMFDQVWGHKYLKAPGDTNTYTTGIIDNHNIVLACMPGIGKSRAAGVAASFRSSYTRIRLALLVGICGGVPNGTDSEKEVLLGDVVISTEIVQYDLGRRSPGRFIRKNTLDNNSGRPNIEILPFLARITSPMNRKQLGDNTSKHLEALLKKSDFEQSRYPGPDKDKLFEPTYHHKHHKYQGCTICTNCNKGEDEVCENALKSSCSVLKCDQKRVISRNRLVKAKEGVELPRPVIHYGKIASGDTIMRSGEARDEIAREEKVIAFEMEGAGVRTIFPCIIIKGVCDYADSHKNKEWQVYAAATAASCMKAFLREWSVYMPKLLHLGMFEMGPPLGKGRFGRVYLARERSFGHICVLKVLEKREIQQCNLEKQVRREIEVQSNLRHPNILMLYGHFHDRERIFLVLEFAFNGDLSKHLRHEKQFSEQKAAQYIAQIAAAIRYLQKKHVIHRDLKPENILVGVHGEVKIADFGSSIHAETNRRNTMCGTLDYLAPEIIKAGSQNNSYTNKVDLWALGVLTYEFLVGKAPFDDAPEMTYERIIGGHMTVPSSVSVEAEDLIKGLLVLDPEKRLSIEQVQKHPWIIKHCGKGEPFSKTEANSMRGQVLS